MKRWKIVAFAVVALGGAVALAAPALNISEKLHPNLFAAQKSINQAYTDLDAAQKANDWDMSGHAAKAKALLEQASDEIKQAAEAANVKNAK